jgi:hypothetical protein
MESLLDVEKEEAEVSTHVTDEERHKEKDREIALRQRMEMRLSLP